MFTTPSQGFNPENNRGGVPLDIPSSPVDPETRYSLFENMQNEIDTGGISSDQAAYLLMDAFRRKETADQLLARFTRPGGFMGRNSYIGGGGNNHVS